MHLLRSHPTTDGTLADGASRIAARSRPARRALHARRDATGFALIEALIAILIFSLATLGLLGLEVSMTRAQSSAKYRADAAYLASDLIGTIWSDARNRGFYDDASCPGYARCKAWQDRLKATLPGGAASAAVNTTTGAFTLTIRWQVPNEAPHSYSTATSVNPND
jgi:type IV pilus assembly protein PilV